MACPAVSLVLAKISAEQGYRGTQHCPYSKSAEHKPFLIQNHSEALIFLLQSIYIDSFCFQSIGPQPPSSAWMHFLAVPESPGKVALRSKVSARAKTVIQLKLLNISGNTRLCLVSRSLTRNKILC